MSSSSGSNRVSMFDETSEEFQRAMRFSEEYLPSDDIMHHKLFAQDLIRYSDVDEDLALNYGIYEWKAMKQKLAKIEKAIRTLDQELNGVPIHFAIDTAIDLGTPYRRPEDFYTLPVLVDAMVKQLFTVTGDSNQTKYEEAVAGAKPTTRTSDAGLIGRRNAQVIGFLGQRWRESGGEVDQTWINTARSSQLTPYLKFIHRGLEAAGIIECDDGEFDMAQLTAAMRHHREYSNKPK